MAANVAATATGSATRAILAWQEKRRRDEPDDEETEGETAGRRTRPRQLRLDAHPERARDGVDARLVGELAEGKDQWERECDDGADRGGEERSRQAGGEPDDEPDEPQREEVEAVAVVESVVAPWGARERGDDEQAGDVGGGEERDEAPPRNSIPLVPARVRATRTIGATATGTIAR